MGNICSASDGRRHKKNNTITANQTEFRISHKNNDEIKSVSTRNFDVIKSHNILEGLNEEQNNLNKNKFEYDSEYSSNKNKTGVYNNRNNPNGDLKFKKDYLSSKECEMNNNDKNSTFVLNTDECKQSSIKLNNKLTIENKKTSENDICSNRYNYEEQNNKDLLENEKIINENNIKENKSDKECKNNIFEKKEKKR